MNMPPNLNKMLEQAQKLQEDMAAATAKLAEEKIAPLTGGAMGGGAPQGGAPQAGPGEIPFGGII